MRSCSYFGAFSHGDLVSSQLSAPENHQVLLPDLRIMEESTEVLTEYALVPIAFQVRSRFRAQPILTGEAGVTLVEEPVEPYFKDYDAHTGEGPLSWSNQWDLSNWGLLCAFRDTERVGGAVVAWNTAGVDMLQGRDDLAVLWDLRVSPQHRGQGIGRALFQAATDWAIRRNCRELLVETQNVNVPACRFYARQGCRLGAIHPHVYADLPDEVQVLWHLDLRPDDIGKPLQPRWLTLDAKAEGET